MSVSDGWVVKSLDSLACWTSSQMKLKELEGSTDGLGVSDGKAGRSVAFLRITEWKSQQRRQCTVNK